MEHTLGRGVAIMGKRVMVLLLSIYNYVDVLNFVFFYFLLLRGWRCGLSSGKYSGLLMGGILRLKKKRIVEVGKNCVEGLLC